MLGVLKRALLLFGCFRPCQMRVAKAVEVKPPDSNDVPTPTKFRQRGMAGAKNTVRDKICKQTSSTAIWLSFPEHLGTKLARALP